MSFEDVVSTLDAAKSKWAAQILDAAVEERPQLLVAYLRRLVGQALDKLPEEIPTGKGFIELGLDSLMVMDLVSIIAQDFQMALYPRELFDSPTIEALAKYLNDEILRIQGASCAPGKSSKAAARPLPAKSMGQAALKPAKRIPGAVFLLSSPRAGSTLLRVMLAGHPRLFCPPELHLLPFATMRSRREELRASYLGEGFERALMEVKGFDAQEAMAFVDALAERDAGIQDVYAMLQEAAGGRLLVDKSPSYGANMETLENAEALFENSRYIFLVRHPYATIDSIIRRRIDRLVGVQDTPPDVFAEELWAATNRNVLTFLQRIEPERHIRVHYEDLVTAPSRVMNDLCAFLGVPFDPATLKPYEGKRMTDGLHENSLGIGDPNFLNHDAIVPDLGEVWKEKKLWRRLGGFAREVAVELEYELPGQGTSASAPVDVLGAFEEGRL